MTSPIPPLSPVATRVVSQPTTLSARAALRLANGPLDALTLMRDVCQVEQLQRDAAERMAVALLSSHDEFVHLCTGHWAVRNAVGSPMLPPPSATPSLHDVAFAVVDVETTGTHAAGSDRITEIAIARVTGGQVREVYSQLVNPERLIPAHITAMTQITWDMVKDKPCFRHVATQVTTRIAGHVFVAHNASFDWRFVSEELRRGSGQLLSGPKLCTVRLARVLLPQLARRSLDHVTHHFGIDIAARHRAAGDAEATARVLLRLLDIAADRGICTWGELDALAMRPAARRGQSAQDKRRRTFPHPAIEDHIA